MIAGVAVAVSAVPRAGVVFEITTDDAERAEDDLVDLALATSTLAADEWDRRYG